MKKFIAVLCCLLLVAALCGGAMASGLDIHIPTLDEVLVSHRVLLSDEGDTYKEYIVLFYAEGSHVVRQINDEIHFDKNAGLTLEDLKAQDYSEFYPGLDSLDFADVLVSDAGDYYSVVIRFKQLHVLVNMDAMKDAGILSSNPNDPVYDADFLVENMTANGMRELDMSEYGGLGLNFIVE